MNNVRKSGHAGHLPVLPGPIIELLAPTAGMTMLDCTVGRGGHAALIAPLLGPTGRYIAMDMDEGNLSYAKQRLSEVTTPCDFVHANFADARQALDDLGVDGVDLLLADLGFASNQMDDPARGFSFDADGPLDMRLDPSAEITAASLVNGMDERGLADLIFQLGEEPLSRKIARKIIDARKQAPISTTRVLASVVRSAYGSLASRSRVDPATRTFMALRIAVNGELDALRQLLTNLPSLMNDGGRAAIISFHSLEDRLVKQRFVELQQADQGQRITRKPAVADETERHANPRSRSAKLRVFAFAPVQVNNG
jgi:16S rRNA (cytosine1402-N4)-methyltransferase